MRPAYLSQKLAGPLPTKDGGTLRTIREAREYIASIGNERQERRHWQEVSKQILAQADVIAVWQCNDIRVTVTARDPFSIEYDLGGTIWGGGHFIVIKGAFYFNERPCLPLQPVG